MRPTASMAGQAAVRELAALVDGPQALRWFWREDLEQMQAAAQRMGHPLEHPAAVYRLYQPTGEWVEHPTEPTGVHGRAWRHQEPPAAARRVLVTGSRTWTDTGTIRDALAFASVWGDGAAVLVSGRALAARTGSRRRAGPGGAATSNATGRTGTGTGAPPGTGATPRWSTAVPTCASHSSGATPAVPATPPRWLRPPASPPTATPSAPRKG